MNTPYAIRLAIRDDINGLCVLELEFDRYYESCDFEGHYERVNSDKIPEGFYSKSILESFDDSNSRIFIAEVNGKIVGSSIVVKEEKKPVELYSIGYVGHIESIFVLDAYREKGVGKALMDAMFAWLSNEGVTVCTLSVLEKNTEALKLYEKLGFEKERIKMYKQIS